MSCKSIFVNLGGGGGGSVNTGVLQIAGGVALDSTLRFVETQNGTDSILKLSTTKVSFLPIGANELTIQADATLTDYTAFYFGASYKIMSKAGGAVFINIDNSVNFANGLQSNGAFNTNGFYVASGTITQNGLLTVKSSGGNIASFRNSSNVEVASINSIGSITCPFFGTANNQIGSNYIGLNGLGLTNSSGKLVITDGGFSNYNGLIVGYNTQKGIEVSVSSSNVAVGFFGSPSIIQPTTAIGEATYVNNGGGSIHIDDTIGGYTMQQIVQALQNLGLLA
jgi:hypothetical protein